MFLKTTLTFPGVDLDRVSEIHRFFKGPSVRSKVFKSCKVQVKDAIQISTNEEWGGEEEGVLFAKVVASTLNAKFGTQTMTIEVVQELELCDWELTPLGNEENGISLKPKAGKKITIGCPKEIMNAIFDLFCPRDPNDKWVILKLQS